jgi:hypothetical protein
MPPTSSPVNGPPFVSTLAVPSSMTSSGALVRMFSFVFISISAFASWQSHDANSVGVGNFDFQMIIALSSGDYSGSAMVVL